MSRTCPSCGAAITTDDALHCHRCGTRLDAQDVTWPTENDAATGDTGGDWRTAAEQAGVGYGDSPHQPTAGAPGSSATPTGLRQDSTTWAIGAHLSAFLGAWILLAFLGPLVVWLVKREDDPFVEGHAREALNFNLTLFVLLVTGFLATVVTLGFGALIVVPVAGILALAWIVLTIVATIKAANGETYSYPMTIRFVK